MQTKPIDLARRLMAEGADKATVLNFFEWLKKHETVWIEFERFALQAARSGRSIGAKAVAERLRWEIMIEQVGGDDYKINNNWVAYLVRLFQLEHPEHENYFEVRKITGVSDGE